MYTVREVRFVPTKDQNGFVFGFYYWFHMFLLYPSELAIACAISREMNVSPESFMDKRAQVLVLKCVHETFRQAKNSLDYVLCAVPYI